MMHYERFLFWSLLQFQGMAILTKESRQGIF